MRFLFFTLLLSGLCACGTNRMASYERGQAADDIITSSLFDYKERSISEADIQRILDGKIKVRDTVRVALFQDFSSSVSTRYNNRGWYAGIDEERLKTNQMIVDSLTAALKRSGRVAKVISMPSMIVGNTPDINRLRESAVRLQADMLLIFAIKSDLFHRYKSLKKDDAKAYATCQSVLMDIRTGVIPHTTVITKEFYSKKESTDLTLDDMRRRVQNQAVMLTVGETGRGVEIYLNGER